MNLTESQLSEVRRSVDRYKAWADTMADKPPLIQDGSNPRLTEAGETVAFALVEMLVTLDVETTPALTAFGEAVYNQGMSIPLFFSRFATFTDELRDIAAAYARHRKTEFSEALASHGTAAVTTSDAHQTIEDIKANGAALEKQLTAQFQTFAL